MTLLESIMKTDKPNIIIGYTTRRHLVLDLDNTTLTRVIGLVALILAEFQKVGDCLIVLSSLGSDRERTRYTRLGRPLRVRSLNNYHLVFDATIGYNSACKIISILAGLSVLNRDYLKIRKFRGDMTIRISPSVYTDRIKPFPKPIYYFQSKHPYKRGGNIDKYISMLRNIYPLFINDRYYFSSDTQLQLLTQRCHLLPQL